MRDNTSFSVQLSNEGLRTNGENAKTKALQSLHSMLQIQRLCLKLNLDRAINTSFNKYVLNSVMMCMESKNTLCNVIIDTAQKLSNLNRVKS